MTLTQSQYNEEVFIGLGSNLGDRHGTLQRAVTNLSRDNRISVQCVSPFEETDPWGVENQPRFVNGVALITTSFDPLSLLAFLKETERHMGRAETFRWGPRVIDLDILLFGNRLINEPSLVVPHREITNRPFVLSGLLALRPKLTHPQTGLPLASYLES